MAVTPNKDAVFSKLLKAQSYKCHKCGVKHKALVTKSASGYYREVDEFESAHAKSVGIQVMKVFLRLNFYNGVNTDLSFSNIVALCPLCTQAHLRGLKIDFRRKSLDGLEKVGTVQISIVKGFFRNQLGSEISTRNTLALIQTIHKFFKDEHE